MAATAPSDFRDDRGRLRSALQLMDERSVREHRAELRSLQRRSGGRNRHAELSFDWFEREDPGYPLGRGMPQGRTLRLDGESHRDAWMRIMRADPCSYCDRRPCGTVDHVEPQSKRARGIGGSHSWLNYAGACPACNSRKGATPLLTFLLRRKHGK